MSGSGREALQDVQKSSGGPPVCPGVVGRPSQMSGSRREVLPYVQEWSEGPSGCPGVVGRSSRMSGSGLETSSMFRSGWEVL